MNIPVPNVITIQLRKLVTQYRISGQMLDDLRLSIDQDAANFFADQLVMTLATRIQCANLPPDEITKQRTHITRQPSSWWQMLKQAHAPQWALRRWPVRETATEHTLEICVNLRRFHVYPDAPAIPHDGYQLIIPSHEMTASAYWIAGGDGR